MSFWQHLSNPEPLKQYRWYMYFGELKTWTTEASTNFGKNPEEDIRLDTHIYALKECTKPSYTIDTSSHVLLNHTFNYPKNVVWGPIKVKMISAVDKKSLPLGFIFQYLLYSGGYMTPDQENSFNLQQIRQISKTELSFQKIDIFQVGEDALLSETGEMDDKIETWSLYNAFIKNVNFGTLSYNSEEFVDIEFDIVYDYAKLEANKYINNLKKKVDAAASEENRLKGLINSTSPNIGTQILGGEPEGRGVVGRIGGKTISFDPLSE